MRNNFFCFGDTYWYQKTGTAMGTPPAPMYATLYFAIHEGNFIPLFPQLTFYRRYIDDGFGIWVDQEGLDNSMMWENFKTTFDQFGKLRWTFSQRQASIEFLDTVITIGSDGLIETDLYAKALNLYLYLPPLSAHPPGVLKGLIFGMFHRVTRLISQPHKRTTVLQQFWNRLIARGYKISQLKPLFAEGFKLPPDRTTPSVKAISPLYFHVRYHPADPAASVIQRFCRQYFVTPWQGPHLTKLRNFDQYELGVDRVVVAYHRPRNLKESLAPRKLKSEGIPVSELIAHCRQLLAPQL
jgi:hypothetical protein